MTALAFPRPQRFNATSYEVGEQSAHKPLGKFGSASIRKPVSEAIAKATEEDAHHQRPESARGRG